MTTVKVRDLAGDLFDWAAAKATVGSDRERWFSVVSLQTILKLKCADNQEIAIAAMTAKGISVEFVHPKRWHAYMGKDKQHLMPGSTPVRAIMRCLITSKFGESIDIPADVTDANNRSSIS